MTTYISPTTIRKSKVEALREPSLGGLLAIAAVAFYVYVYIVGKLGGCLQVFYFIFVFFPNTCWIIGYLYMLDSVCVVVDLVLIIDMLVRLGIKEIKIKVRRFF